MAFHINSTSTRTAAACFALQLYALSLHAQSLEAPSDSYVFHAASRSLRQVVGMPGSSYLGAARFSNLDAASVSPSGNSALLRYGQNTRFVGNLQDRAAKPVKIEGLLKGIDRILWSENSSVAVAFSPATRQLQWVRALDSAPAAMEPVSLESVPGDLELLAVNGAAVFAYIVSREGDSGKLYRIASDEPLRLAAVMGNPVSAAVDPRDQTLYVMDRPSRQLHSIRERQGGSVDELLATLPESSIPADIAVDPTTSDVYIVDQESRSIVIYSSESRTLSRLLPLESALISLERFGRFDFLIVPGGSGPGPLLVLRSGKSPEILFIPTGDRN